MPYDKIVDSAALETALTGVGDAIRRRNGETAKYDLLNGDMAAAVDAIPAGGDGNEKLQKIISRTDGNGSLAITSADLAGVTKIGDYAFRDCDALGSIQIPEGITSIGSNAFYGCSYLTGELVLPVGLTSIGSSAFYNSKISTLRILHKNTNVSYGSSALGSCSNLTRILVPAARYLSYLSSSGWKDYANIIYPWGEYVFDPNMSGGGVFGDTLDVSVTLTGFDATPEFSVTSDNEAIATVSNIAINSDNTEITFTVNLQQTEGDALVTLTVNGTEQTFTYSGSYAAIENYVESTYEVVDIPDAAYGFALNDDGYWTSQNKGVNNSYAICQVNISNPLRKKVYFDCINYAESSYDYGLLSNVDTALTLSNTADTTGVFHNFKSKQYSYVQSVAYDVVDADSFFVQVKFRKDGSTHSNNDTIQFKVRFEW